MKEQKHLIKVNENEIATYQKAIDEFGNNWASKYEQGSTSTRYCRIVRTGDTWVRLYAKRHTQYGGAGFGDGWCNNYGGHNYWIIQMDRVFPVAAGNCKIIMLEQLCYAKSTFNNKREMLEFIEKLIVGGKAKWIERTGGVEPWQRNLMCDNK